MGCVVARWHYFIQESSRSVPHSAPILVIRMHWNRVKPWPLTCNYRASLFTLIFYSLSLNFFFFLPFPFSSSPQTSRLALWAVWYWRTMSKHTTRTSPQLFLTSSSRSVSITSATPHRSSVPPLVSFSGVVLAHGRFPSVPLWRWCINSPES